MSLLWPLWAAWRSKKQGAGAAAMTAPQTEREACDD